MLDHPFPPLSSVPPLVFRSPHARACDEPCLLRTDCRALYRTTNPPPTTNHAGQSTTPATAVVGAGSDHGGAVLGTTAPPGEGEANVKCVDLLLFGEPWRDREGDTCFVYASGGFCNTNGTYGLAWGDGGDTFEDYAQGGMTAPAACCGCGGGNVVVLTAAPTIPATTTLVTTPAATSTADTTARHDPTGTTTRVHPTQVGTASVVNSLNSLKSRAVCVGSDASCHCAS